MTKPPLRLIVAGWRHASTTHHASIIRTHLTPYWLRHTTRVILIHGQCPYGGADWIADQIATEWGWQTERHPPKTVNGRILGPQRNTRMVSLGADQVEAFPHIGSRGRGGTWNLIHQATDAGIPTHINPLTPERNPA